MEPKQNAFKFSPLAQRMADRFWNVKVPPPRVVDLPPVSQHSGRRSFSPTSATIKRQRSNQTQPLFNGGVLGANAQTSVFQGPPTKYPKKSNKDERVTHEEKLSSPAWHPSSSGQSPFPRSNSFVPSLPTKGHGSCPDSLNDVFNSNISTTKDESTNATPFSSFFPTSSGGFSFNLPTQKQDKPSAVFDGANETNSAFGLNFSAATSTAISPVASSPIFFPPIMSPTTPLTPLNADGVKEEEKEGEEGDDDVSPVTDGDPKFAAVMTSTGEEDETILWQGRAKLYRLADNAWKDRGVGDIKILKNNETGKKRLVMRNESGRILANHQIADGMKLATHGDKPGWRWTAIGDVSDGSSETVNLFARMQTQELADGFKQHFQS